MDILITTSLFFFFGIKFGKNENGEGKISLAVIVEAYMVNRAMVFSCSMYALATLAVTVK